MKVILLENVETLGKIGDIVSVRDGYARNFLLPKGLVMHYTTDAVTFIEKRKKQETQRYAKEVEKAQELAEKIANVSCTVKVQAGDDDKLYGSVTAIDIQNALEQEGVAVDKRKIVIEEPIKKLGIYTISIQLLPEVTSALKVWVVRS